MNDTRIKRLLNGLDLTHSEKREVETKKVGCIVGRNQKFRETPISMANAPEVIRLLKKNKRKSCLLHFVLSFSDESRVPMSHPHVEKIQNEPAV